MKTAAAAVAVLAAGAHAFVAPSSGLPVARSAAGLRMAAVESDLPVNLVNPDFYWGEEKYKNYVDTYKGNALVTRVYPVLDRVREKKLLTKTAETGLLSALEDAGLTLSQAEALLPVVEDLGLLSFAANNAEFLLNTAAFLAVEPAELALPLVVGVVKGGPGLLNTVAAVSVLAEVATVVGTQSPVLSGLAAVPFLGTAFAANYAAGLLGSLSDGAIAAKRAAAAAPAAKKAAPKAAGGAKPVAAKPVAAKVIAAKPAAAPVKYVAPARPAPTKRAGNLANIPKRRAA